VELKIEFIFICKSFLTDDCLHSLCIFTLSVKSIHLVRYIRMIVSCHTFTNSTLHQSGKRWQHINWWVNTSLVHVSIDVDLTFCNITCQVWDRMCDIIIRHCQDRNLCDRTNSSGDSTSSLVDCGQICVHITWITSSTWYFFSGCRDFSQSVCIRSHISKNG